jgi:hypothetical protein
MKFTGSRLCRSLVILLTLSLLAGCNLPLPRADSIAATVTAARAGAPTAAIPSPVGPTPVEPTPADSTPVEPPTAVGPSPVPDTPTPIPPTPTSPPSPGGVSLNCDGTYQRLRITDGGASGKTVSVDSWDGSSWVNVWNIFGGDPMIRQIEAEAGYYTFGACQKLVIVPIRYSGSGAILELGIHAWNGSGLSQVYFNDGVHGSWSKVGDNVIFEESLYLYGEPNCCPCSRQTLQYTWDGSAFVQTGSAITPTYVGTPPPICVP